MSGKQPGNLRKRLRSYGIVSIDRAGLGRWLNIDAEADEAVRLIKPATGRRKECAVDAMKAIAVFMTSDEKDREALLHTTKLGRRALRDLDVQLERVEVALRNENLGDRRIKALWPGETAEKRRTVKDLIEEGSKSSVRWVRLSSRRKRKAAQLAKDLLSQHGTGTSTAQRVAQLATLISGLDDVEVSHGRAVMRGSQVKKGVHENGSK